MRTMTKAAPRPDTGAAGDEAEMGGIGEGVLTGDGPEVAAGLGRMVGSAAWVQARIARFGAHRLRRALDAQAEMLACRTPEALCAAQIGYLSGLSEDYAREWGRLFAAATRPGPGQPDPVEERHATPV
ncbi:hypothetical protein [Jannaschia formosa]|uniref:hypothetical protein n=1 Tax=Jannaschia formosa TaxID=2259592 RepID=UPI000E1B6993|nr:hypothetical protein [Jannaschia formosa]TFL17177.1 hypothetical protein DR046_15980 [Jannaschia formosa]